ncbi:MAG: hypothetical protein ACI9NQ_001594, partial [Paracoccaceae bacterium]
EIQIRNPDQKSRSEERDRSVGNTFRYSEVCGGLVSLGPRALNRERSPFASPILTANRGRLFVTFPTPKIPAQANSGHRKNHVSLECDELAPKL